ncbi:HPr-rel-A system PqqD family peptide chaperone [Sphingorhabdus sp.]|uniref:HPr-rel-A system PqqD family peptide chaperone n=1 Tax=Sphingorhabdus sp. TaxID=1902408 RepID=UPI00391BB6E5
MSVLPAYAYVLAENAPLIIEPLDAMTLIYQRRSGMTHIVAEPIPQILMAMGSQPQTAQDTARRLAMEFDFGENTEVVVEIVTSRLEEMAELGFLERVRA